MTKVNLKELLCKAQEKKNTNYIQTVLSVVCGIGVIYD